ncbi:DUF1622 domain-containing protein [Sediminitomix flava]|uniref:Putative membrane protein n=1 Tax=Sediminitomix flava TaxID=379075 RepID=A0A315ZTS1_SEDFL|nr:DUF1622 domain-containing protein [Sediminitomix flava]PWJ38634.1 putative membrane protein [Sediminitomix flava]
MEEIKNIFWIIAEIIEVVAMTILIYGFLKVFIKFICIEGKDITKVDIYYIQRIRCQIGIYILLALDFLITSDIIFTLSELSEEQMISLSLFIVTRIAIGYFLGKEIKELSEEKQDE